MCEEFRGSGVGEGWDLGEESREREQGKERSVREMLEGGDSQRGIT